MASAQTGAHPEHSRAGRGRRMTPREENTMKIKNPPRASMLAAAVAATLLASVAAHAATLNIETATIAEIDAALAKGKLTSEKLVQAYLKRIEAYDKQGPS